jgi:hypothetical protein
MVALNKPLFRLGKLVATPGALEALDKAGQQPWQLLLRHFQGDWGDLDDEDRRLNDEAVTDGSRILSAYTLKTGVRLGSLPRPTEARRVFCCRTSIDARSQYPPANSTGMCGNQAPVQPSPPPPKGRTMTDDTNRTGLDRHDLEAAYGKVWDEEELAQEFKVTAIIALQAVVVRNADGQVGSLSFQNQPRFYFNFQPDPGFGDA